jgi:hypothetical protein
MSTLTHDSKTTDKEVFDSAIPSTPKSLSKHFHEFLIKILRYGKIPRHIGFIMDGNRRFARKMNVQTAEGHYRGFLKMEEASYRYMRNRHLLPLCVIGPVTANF